MVWGLDSVVTYRKMGLVPWLAEELLASAVKLSDELIKEMHLMDHWRVWGCECSVVRKPVHGTELAPWSDMSKHGTCVYLYVAYIARVSNINHKHSSLELPGPDRWGPIQPRCHFVLLHGSRGDWAGHILSPRKQIQKYTHLSPHNWISPSTESSHTSLTAPLGPQIKCLSAVSSLLLFTSDIITVSAVRVYYTHTAWIFISAFKYW